MIIQWGKDFELGIPLLDEQHKRLISIINKLDTERRKGQCSENVENIFLELINYCNYHFTIEENAMGKKKFPRLDLHIAAHDLFIKNIHEFYYKSKKDDCYALSDTINFLSDWLIDHIMVEDRCYVPAVSDWFKRKS